MIRRETSTGHGVQDRQRYLDKIRDRVRKALPSIPGNAPIISGPGDQPVTVPIPGGGLGLPHFVPASPETPPDGWAQGPGQPGDIIRVIPPGGSGSGDGDPGTEPGDHDIDLTMTLDEWRQWILEDLQLPELRPKPTDQLTDPETVWTSRSRVGSQSTVDKRATLKEALRRSQQQRQPLRFTPDDLRYHSWVERDRPATAAVIYFLRDISASMGGERAYLARATAWYLAAVIQRAYPQCPIHFWVHDTAGREVPEADFLTLTEGGGTAAVPVYQAMQIHMDHGYPFTSYNRYVFHFTDGDLWDATQTEPLIAQWAPTLARFGVVLTAHPDMRALVWAKRIAATDAVRVAVDAERADVVPAVRYLLGEGDA
ncbi:DUF444 family protein [Sulfobacillus harzensis]|uniref:DUF444 family protein n=1 Tax=Sulfobacillus harzensis TaxID=2729629 RepID=A0A7Y0L7F5_9FIRM|nr:DUF444 family protein [Sulfobacillus harzensis]NMP23820.1 DUF444 family protein [Sulfobacillus harzensis]